jgi:hypothetical protein
MRTRRERISHLTDDLRADFLLELAKTHAMYAHEYRLLAKAHEEQDETLLQLMSDRDELDARYVRHMVGLCRRYGVPFNEAEFRASMESIA